MKNYLNTSQRQDFLFLKKYMHNTEKMINTWGSLNKQELKSLRMSLSWARKAYESILENLDATAFETLIKSLQQTHVTLKDTWAMKQFQAGLKSQLDAAYMEHKDYYDLMESVIETNCKDCDKNGADCKFYQLFAGKNIPEPVPCNSNCRYSFTLDYQPQDPKKWQKLSEIILLERAKKLNIRY